MKSFAAPQKYGDLDLEALLHPAAAFDRPADVLNGVDPTVNEKRAILASWAPPAKTRRPAGSFRALVGRVSARR